MLFYDVRYFFKAPLKVGHDVPYTFGMIDHYPFHDNVRWDTWGRFAEKCTAYQPYIWTASNHEIEFAPEIDNTNLSNHTSIDVMYHTGHQAIIMPQL
ncbi:hypothetical protein OROMI_003630 [Orobanche minor]